MTSSEIRAVKMLFTDYQKQWAVCGGWAIDLFLGKKTREHKDIDLFIWRYDQLYVQQFLVAKGWQLQVAANDKLSDWAQDAYLDLPVHTIWCKHKTYHPNFIELLMNESNTTHFLFRRDTRVKLYLDKIIHISEDGIPYLTPEIALLYKANNLANEGNQHDFDICYPHLTSQQQKWLQQTVIKLYGKNHQWVLEDR